MKKASYPSTDTVRTVSNNAGRVCTVVSMSSPQAAALICCRSIVMYTITGKSFIEEGMEGPRTPKGCDI